MSIHTTAIVDKKAEVSTDVEIGPYAVIGPNVRLESRVRVMHHASVFGNTVIESGVEIHPFCSIGGAPQDFKYKGEPVYCRVGARTILREYVTINAGSNTDSKGTQGCPTTQIGSDSMMMAYAHLGHNTVVGSGVVIANSGALAGHVTVGDDAIIGGLVGVHQFVHIGKMVIIGGCSKVVKDIPPYMLAQGNPAKVRYVNKVGLRRKGFSPQAINHIKNAFVTLYAGGLNVSQAFEKLQVSAQESLEVKEILDFIEMSDRGLATREVKSGAHE
jgi:UDP-N-acetylglucosamine acyltransferase